MKRGVGKILVTRSSMPEIDEYVNEIRNLWDSHWLTNMGEKHNELEKKLANFWNIRKEQLTLFVNGHQALECIFEAMKLGKEKNKFGEIKNEVITSPYTFASTIHALVRKGLKPVFCDINQNNFTINTAMIEGLITRRTCAIVPIHVYGNVCNVEDIEEIASKNNLKVVYDSAHAFGVTYRGKSIAKYGDASMFSFHATKVFNTIEGGAACFKNDNLKPLLEKCKNLGITGPESVEFIAGNAKMNEFSAAMGICNLRHFREEMEKRKKVDDRYRERLTGIDGLTINVIQKEVKRNYAYFPLM